MPLTYSKKTVLLNSMLELLAFFLLWPKVLLLRCSSSSKAKPIVLVEPFGMGDILSLSVMLDPLSEAFPDVEILLLTKKGNDEVYAGDPRIARVYTAPFPWSRLSGGKRGSIRDWLNVIKTCREIACLKPNIGLDTRSEIRSQILMVLCGCCRRVGFTNYLNTNINVRGLLLTTKVKKPDAMHRYEMNRLLLREGLGVALSPLRFPCFQPTLQSERLISSEPVVLFHVGARWKYRQWPTERWVELGGRLNAEGIEPCVVGAPGEEDVLNRICGETGFTKVVAGMNRLIQLVKGCDLLVCLDSGPMHLAQTLGTPVVAMFGPGDFDLWQPLGIRDRYVFHRLPCNPCLQLDCVRPDDSCMRKIAVNEVFDQIIGVLKNG